MVQYVKGAPVGICGRNFRNCENDIGEAHVGAWVLLRDGGRGGRATIKAYIESQKWDEDDQGFKITSPTEP
jgi:hypothetical protein